MKKALNFVRIGFWILAANAFARDITGHLMQFQRHAKPLFTSHLAIAFNLFVQCRCRSHLFSIIQFAADYNFKSLSVTAPSDALVTWAAYFASTPRV